MRFFDRAASWMISIGGIGTIVAVSGVCLYLLWTVAPLFLPASVGEPIAVQHASSESAVAVLRVSDSHAVGWTIDRSGQLTVFRPDQGEVLRRESLVGDREPPTAISAGLSDDRVALGFRDGTVKLGTVGLTTSFFEAGSDETHAFESLPPGERVAGVSGVVFRTAQGLLRNENVTAVFDDAAIEISPGAAVLLLDTLSTDSGPVLLAWSDDGTARIATVGRTEDLFTGEVHLEAGAVATLPLHDAPAGPPLFVGLAARAAGASLVWEDGTLLRFDVRDVSKPRLIERAQLSRSGARLTQVAHMVGQLTLLVGDEAGQVSAWFPVRDDTGGSSGASASVSTETQIVRGHDLGTGPAAVVAIAPSSRSREATVGYADGTIRVFQVTNEVELASLRLPDTVDAGGGLAVYTPPAEGETALYAAADGLFAVPLDLRHPESGFATYFRPIWYESYAAPRHVWQTSSGTNAAEPKLGLMPLVFGTIKATFYSMLFGVPLALLAAVYTSEFLSKPMRARVKPVIEVMASLPSVVLGFLAAVVFAPFVEDWLPAVIAAGLSIPLALLASAHLWQLGPWSARTRWNRWRLPLAGLALALGIVLAIAIGPLLEYLLFAGDVKLWLDGQIGSGAGAWMLLLTPVCAIGVAAAIIRWINPLVTEASSRWGGQRFAAVDLLRFFGAVTVTFLVASLLSFLLAGLDSLLPIDLDPRGSFVDTFTQRNALVVGFVMGFAIIPLIYTLADDALSAVPESLRSASLGAGATQWQTALRVVIPTAMSGLFSAIMVGLGRAVGETMIVLMAAGNTPIMEMNIFNGFQTLSAAIATEMPEAVRGSTHFRTLFLAALVLFGLTFLVNTVAELVRIRFRRRVVQL